MREALFRGSSLRLAREWFGRIASRKLTPKDLLEFRDRYVVAKNGVISVFGNVKAAEVKQIFEQALGKMKPASLALTDAPQPPVARPSRRRSKAERTKRRACSWSVIAARTCSVRIVMRSN